MLIELPTADEIDELATTTPSLVVRRFEFDFGGDRLDLEYRPCKGEAVVVIRGSDGVALLKGDGDDWMLPSGRIGTDEEPSAAARRVARESCGLGLRSLVLVGLYDVTRHYSNVSLKRLSTVYLGETDDTPGEDMRGRCAFHLEDLESLPVGELDSAAVADCLEK